MFEGIKNMLGQKEKAEEKPETKTGIIFEGGGLRGIFAAGVIDYLLDNRIIIKNVMGVSAGACHACSYVSGQRGRSYAVSTDYLEDKRVGFGLIFPRGIIYFPYLLNLFSPNSL